MRNLVIMLIFGAFFFLSVGCQTPPASKNPPPAQETRIALYWENTSAKHPEREPWSNYLVALFRKDLDTFKKASDISIFCPKFHSLGEQDQLKALGEFWVAVAYYESGFNPKSAAVDVGTQSDKNTWSVGLYQMSVVDQKNYRLDFGYDYDDLLEPLPNIHLGLAVLKAQVLKRGVLAVLRPNPGVYWAVLRDKSPEIASRVQKYASKCK